MPSFTYFQHHSLLNISYHHSSCDWTFAGSESAGARLRVRISPTAETLERLQQRDRQIEAMRRQIKELAEARKAAAVKLELELAAAASATGEEGNNTSVSEGGDSATVVSADNLHLSAEQVPATTESGNVAAPTAPVPASASAAVSTAEETQQARIKYDIVLTAERSWLSHTLKLFPGDYYVFADVSYSMPYEQAFKMTIPAHLSEAPWLDGKHPINALKLDAAGSGDNAKSFTRRSTTAIVSPGGAGAGDVDR